MLPPMSVPVSRAERPHAIATADAPDEPPGARSRSHGFAVAPNSSFQVWQSPDHSGKFVLANTTAPAALSRATAAASVVGTREANSFEPPVVRMPAVSSASLTLTGRPCIDPHQSPRTHAAQA